MVMGDSLFLAGGLCFSLMALSFLMKKSGNHYLKSLLNNFNNWQDKTNITSIDIKNNLKYHFSIFGQDILCIKQQILQAGTLLCIFLTFMAELSVYESKSQSLVKSFIYSILTLDFNEISSFTSISTSVVGIFSLFNASWNILFILALLVPLGFNLEYVVTVLKNLEETNSFGTMYFLSKSWLFILCSLGKGVILSGICLGTFALCSALAKKSENPQLIKLRKFLETLKDPKKKIQVEKDIEKQRLALEKRRKVIASHNDVNNNINLNLWDKDSNSENEKKITHKASKGKEEMAPKITTKGKEPIDLLAKIIKPSIEPQDCVKIELGDHLYVFQRIYSSTFRKETWGIIINPDEIQKPNLTKYEGFLSNGLIGGGIRPLTGQGSNRYEMGAKMDARLIGKMYNDGVFTSLQKFIPKDNADSLSKKLQESGIQDNVSLIIFSKEAKSHKDIAGVAKNL